MFKVNTIGTDPYIAAQPLVEKSFVEQLIFTVHVSIDILKSLALTLILLLKNIWKLLTPSPPPKSIESQLALVTGGANGFGRYIALRLAAEKCNVVIADLDEVGGQRTAKEIQNKYGVHCESFCVDMSDYEAVESLHEKIRTDIGIVDILVNNVGICPSVSLREEHWTDVDRILRVNINSHVWVSKYCKIKIILRILFL